MSTIIISLQLIVSAGLINVWLFRNAKATDYRGGEAKNLKDEFSVYGLPAGVYYLVGFLKLSSSALFIASIWWPQLLIYPSMIVLGLMTGALLMHIKVKDPVKKSLPALSVLLMSGFLVMVSI